MVDWPHAPIHRFGYAGTYFITAGTHLKQHFFVRANARDALQDLLFTKAKEHVCWLQAWCILSNHYHIVVSTEDGEQLRRMLRSLHVHSAIELNREENTKGRKVWYQFRDTQLTYEGSWLARLRYVHENAVHHGLISNATNYRWWSAAWFENKAPRGFVSTVNRMKIDTINVFDDFAAASPPQP